MLLALLIAAWVGMVPHQDLLLAGLLVNLEISSYIKFINIIRMPGKILLTMVKEHNSNYSNRWHENLLL